MNHQKLVNKNIIISAAADGIGWSIAEHCMNNGANVFLTDIDENKLSLLKNHKNYNINLFLTKTKANDPENVSSYFLKLKDHISNIDGLINNIGIAGPTGKIEDLEIEEWKNTIDVNINSHFYFTKYSIPFLKKIGGSIINISSTAGLFGFPLRTPYTASKWATIGLTKSLAIELGEFNIRVNSVAPGFIDTDMFRSGPEDIQKQLVKGVYLNQRVGLPVEVAKVCLFLASDNSSYVNGENIRIDGFAHI